MPVFRSFVSARLLLSAICLALITAGCSVSAEDVVSIHQTLETGESESPTHRFELVQGELPISEDRLVQFIEFVESETGRAFITPPRIAVQSIEDFEAGLELTDEDLAEAAADAEVDTRYLQAIGQTSLGPDRLLEVLLEIFSSSELILGYFDPDEDTLYLPPAGEDNEEFESTLVHELVHALDHQHVDLAKFLELAETADRERAEGRFEILTVAEGRASAVENRWMANNGIEPDLDVALEPFADVPPSILLSTALPYELGAQMIDGLGGADDTWYLYDELPQSGEQAFFPNKLDRDAPVSMSTPDADGEVLDQGVFGAEAAFLWLIGHTLDPSSDEALAAFTAIDGWRGGAWVLWGDEDESCLRGRISADSARDLDEFASAFEDWQAGAVGRGVTSDIDVDGDELQITACAPYIS